MSDRPLRLAVTGASGNVGTALLRHLAERRPDWEVVGVCRRPPAAGDPAYDRVQWQACDVGDPSAADLLRSAFAGADAVVHAAWLIQPSRDERALERTNVEGTARVVQAAADAGVPHVVHLSSVGAYGPAANKMDEVYESWPVDGVPTSSYSRHKAEVERQLDERRGGPTVTRLRPGLIFSEAAASAITRYFLGPLVPERLVGRLRIPVLPLPDEATFQVVHADDVAAAVVASAERRYDGPVNVAADPVVTPYLLAAAFGARRVAVQPAAVRALAAATYRARLQPTDPGWVDLAFSAPVMSTDRARDVLGWKPRYDAEEALGDLLLGMRHGAGTTSPALRPRRLLRR